MNLFIDTTQKEFVAVLFDNEFNVIKNKISNTKYKVEEILSFFDEIEPNIFEIKNIYINLGPGSFTGSRIALLYIRTIAQLKNINIFTTNSFELINFKENENVCCIFATKTKSYCLVDSNINLVDKAKNENFINYEKIIYSFLNYLDKFTLTSIDKLQPIYASEPQIGSI